MRRPHRRGSEPFQAAIDASPSATVMSEGGEAIVPKHALHVGLVLRDPPAQALEVDVVEHRDASAAKSGAPLTGRGERRNDRRLQVDDDHVAIPVADQIRVGAGVARVDLPPAQPRRGEHFGQVAEEGLRLGVVLDFLAGDELAHQAPPSAGMFRRDRGDQVFSEPAAGEKAGNATPVDGGRQRALVRFVGESCLKREPVEQPHREGRGVRLDRRAALHIKDDGAGDRVLHAGGAVRRRRASARQNLGGRHRAIA